MVSEATDQTMLRGMYAFVAILSLHGLYTVVMHVAGYKHIRERTPVVVATLTMFGMTMLIVLFYVLGLVVEGLMALF